MKLLMKTGRFFKGWVLAALLLVIVIVAGSTVIWVKGSRSQSIEISVMPDRSVAGRIYIGGGVNNPGWYPLFDGDNINDVIRAAGGIKDGVDMSQVEITVGDSEEMQTPQKININRAEAWLLGALPGVGEVKAQAIIDYRQKNGPFRDIYELEKVPGFGESNFSKIKDLITVN